MCTLIKADYLLATILAARESVSFGSLRKIRNKIEAVVPNSVVDISAPEVYAALEFYPEIFEKKEGSIARASTAGKYLESKYLDYEFVNSVPSEIHEKVKEAITASLS